MIQLNLVAEDTILIAERRESNWHVTIADIFHAKSHTLTLTDAQMASVVALCVGGDEWTNHEIVRDGLYEIARPALEDAHVNRDIWPIP